MADCTKCELDIILRMSDYSLLQPSPPCAGLYYDNYIVLCSQTQPTEVGSHLKQRSHSKGQAMGVCTNN